MFFQTTHISQVACLIIGICIIALFFVAWISQKRFLDLLDDELSYINTILNKFCPDFVSEQKEAIEKFKKGFDQDRDEKNKQSHASVLNISKHSELWRFILKISRSSRSSEVNSAPYVDMYDAQLRATSLYCWQDSVSRYLLILGILGTLTCLVFEILSGGETDIVNKSHSLLENIAWGFSVSGLGVFCTIILISRRYKTIGEKHEIVLTKISELITSVLLPSFHLSDQRLFKDSIERFEQIVGSLENRTNELMLQYEGMTHLAKLQKDSFSDVVNKVVNLSSSIQDLCKSDGYIVQGFNKMIGNVSLLNESVCSLRSQIQITLQENLKKQTLSIENAAASIENSNEIMKALPSQFFELISQGNDKVVEVCKEVQQETEINSNRIEVEFGKLRNSIDQSFSDNENSINELQRQIIVSQKNQDEQHIYAQGAIKSLRLGMDNLCEIISKNVNDQCEKVLLNVSKKVQENGDQNLKIFKEESDNLSSHIGVVYQKTLNNEDSINELKKQIIAFQKNQNEQDIHAQDAIKSLRLGMNNSCEIISKNINDQCEKVLLDLSKKVQESGDQNLKIFKEESDNLSASIEEFANDNSSCLKNVQDKLEQLVGSLEVASDSIKETSTQLNNGLEEKIQQVTSELTNTVSMLGVIQNGQLGLDKSLTNLGEQITQSQENLLTQKLKSQEKLENLVTQSIDDEKSSNLNSDQSQERIILKAKQKL